MVSSAELSTYRKNNHNDDLNILQLAQSFWSNIETLIAGFRQRWNRVAAEWFVMPIVIQQNKITTSIIRAFEQVAKEHESAIRIESGYVSELAQQISQLEETVQNLQAQIAEMQAVQAVDVDSDEP